MKNKISPAQVPMLDEMHMLFGYRILPAQGETKAEAMKLEFRCGPKRKRHPYAPN